jgi:ATP-dependent Clp protease ATP-binding subunit ClpA
MQSIGFTKGDDTQYDGIKEKVMDALKNEFRPEFLNRLDDIIVFDVLPRDVIKSIVSIQVEIVKKRLAEKEIELVVSDAVLNELAKEGYNPQFGARPLKRLIQTKILNPVATMMIGNKVLSGGTVLVDLKNGEFAFDVKRGKRSGSCAPGRIRTCVGRSRQIYSLL